MGSDVEGGRAPRRPEMDRAVRGALAEGPDAEVRWNSDHKGQGHAARQPDLPMPRQLYLHYGLDAWMAREFPTIRFERFADDAVIHCVSESQARFVRDAVARRLVKVGLELHPDKTRIVYCKDSRRRGTYEETSLTLLRLHVPASEGIQPTHGRSLHRLSTGGVSGEVDGDEPPSCSADSSACEPDPRRPRSADQSAAAGLARILHRVLPDCGDPHLPAPRSPSGALGEVEVQTTSTQPQEGTSVASGRPNTEP